LEKLKKKDFENLDIKKFYSGKTLENYNHEKRFIKGKIDKDIFDINFFLDKKKDQKELIDIVLEKNNIVLLGNPGIGKTKELEFLFKTLWGKKNELEIIPFFINIKNFNKSVNFEYLIKYSDWKSFERLCFIIDGLDEIPYPQDFISALLLFLQNNNENVKIIISCRTNIYEKYLIKIDDFKYYYLDGLNDFQIKNILKNNFDVNIIYQELNKYRVFLENPFNLNLFGLFHKENGKFPLTIAEAFELSVNKELTLLNREKFVKSEQIDEIHVIHILQEIAIVNELMHQDFIEEKNIYYLFGKDDKSLVEKISFIEKNPESKSFAFRHKNYQEFLSAKYISNLKTEDILQLIKINEINKTIPSLLNTISFLLNILKGDKFNFIKEWLLKHEPEVLFLVDKEILDKEIQKEIFKKYFNDVTVQKTFWFGMDRRFSMEKIAEFADVDYLIFVIKENEYQRRIVKSAFDILNYCKSKFNDLEKIKGLLNQYIFSENDYLIDALQTFGKLNFHIEDKLLFLKICEHLKNNGSKDVHYQILFMFKDFDDIDDHFEIFRISLNIECKVNGFNRSDATWFLEEIILKTNNSENFLEYYKILFNENSNLKLDDFYNHDFEEKLKEKTLNFSNQDNEIIIKIFDIVFNYNQFFNIGEEYLFNLFVECEYKDLLFKHIIENYGITTNTISILSLILEESLISYFVQKLNDGSLTFQDGYTFEMFKNHLSLNNRLSLAGKFENILVKNGYKFNERTLTPKERDEYNENYQVFCQNNFDILFDDESIANNINKFFEENNIEEISFRTLQEIKGQWYKKTHYHSLQNSTFNLIQRSFTKGELLQKEDAIKNASDIYTRLTTIRNKLDNSNSVLEFEVNEKHISWIGKECINFSRKIDFNEVNLYNQNDEEFEKFNILKLILYFDNKFNINYTKEFYLNILKHCNLPNIINNNYFEFIKNRINDLNIFNKQIIENLNNDSLNSKSLGVHIEYALKNKLSSVYPKIKGIILEKFESVFYEKLIEDFISLLPDDEKIEFSKSLINTNVVYLQWKAINILKAENVEKAFLIDFCKKYLDDENKIEHNSNALEVLFKFSDENFLEYFYKSILQIEEHQFLKFINIYGTTDKVNYTLDKNGFNLLKPIFFSIFRNEVKDSFEFQNSRQLFQSFIIQHSKDKKGFIEINNILINIKQSISKKQTSFFYINLIIDECELSYYNSLSKSYSFEEAKNIVRKEELKNIIMGDQINIGNNSTFNNSQIGGQNNNQTNNSENLKTPEKNDFSEKIINNKIDNKIKNWKRNGVILFSVYIIFFILGFIFYKNEWVIFDITKKDWLNFKSSTVCSILIYGYPFLGIYLFYRLLYDRLLDPSKEKAKRDLLKSKL
jgi:hypothetical protein